METKTEKVQKAVITCEVFTEPEQKRLLIDYDLSPLKSIIEFGGVEEITKVLRTLHTDIMEASLASFEKGEQGIFENNPDLIDQLFYIRTLADIFDEINSETYQRKCYPEIDRPEIIKENDTEKAILKKELEALKFANEELLSLVKHQNDMLEAKKN